jgi:uncharacterized protein
MPVPAGDVAIEDTRRWVERAVVGLNLCPFAAAVHRSGRARYALSTAVDQRSLLEDLLSEAKSLLERSPLDRDTTLLIAPGLLHEFIEFCAFLRMAEKAMRRQGFEGILQIASFHPDYRFAESAGEDVANFTNRSPYPTLQLLREESLTRALEAFPDPRRIFEANIASLRRLGAGGWEMLDVGPHA